MDTQTLTSEWGLTPLTVGAEIPTRMLRHRLGREHVGTPDAEIELLVRQAIRKAPQPFNERQTRETVTAALWIHHDNRAEYVAVMTGTL